jgi:hypothetical protein
MGLFFRNGGSNYLVCQCLTNEVSNLDQSRSICQMMSFMVDPDEGGFVRVTVWFCTLHI